MNREEIERMVCQTVALALKRDVAPGLTRTDEPRWDSLKHVEIVFALEDALDVRFAEDELAELDGIDALVAAAERHLVA